MRQIQIFFDGACGPKNPGGRAGWGFAVIVDGTQIAERFGFVGEGDTMSCNVAEYAGILAAMEFATQQFPDQRVTFVGDSNLVVSQMSGRWKVKRGLYAEIARKARQFALGKPFRFEWRPREQNTIADELSKKAIA